MGGDGCENGLYHVVYHPNDDESLSYLDNCTRFSQTRRGGEKLVATGLTVLFETTLAGIVAG
jgi:hypothetical protein